MLFFKRFRDLPFLLNNVDLEFIFKDDTFFIYTGYKYILNTNSIKEFNLECFESTFVENCPPDELFDYALLFPHFNLKAAHFKKFFEMITKLPQFNFKSPQSSLNSLIIACADSDENYLELVPIDCPLKIIPDNEHVLNLFVIQSSKFYYEFLMSRSLDPLDLLHLCYTNENAKFIENYLLECFDLNQLFNIQLDEIKSSTFSINLPLDIFENQKYEFNFLQLAIILKNEFMFANLKFICSLRLKEGLLIRISIIKNTQL